MASKNQLELTFHKPSKRWKKTIHGRVHYFGYGSSGSDRDGYKKAVERYRRFLDEQQKADQPRYSRCGNMTAEELDAVWQNYGRQMAERRRMQAALQTERTSPQAKPTPELVDLFLAEQLDRHNCGQLSASRYNNLKINLRHFKNFCEAGSLRFSAEDDNVNEQILVLFKRQLSDAVGSGDLAQWTFASRLQALKQFIKWSWESRYLGALPRNLDRICKRPQQKPNPKPMTIKQLRHIWPHAPGELRCFMAIALNCGYYAIDIATIEDKHVKDGYLIKPRQKTQVLMKHKLWPVTKQLIDECRNGNPGLIFRSPTGKPLVGGELVNGEYKGRYDYIYQRFRRLCRALSIKDAAFSRLRDTAATMVESIDKSMTAEFLGHVDRRQARFYLGDIEHVDPGLMDSCALDDVIDDLGRRLAAVFEG